MGVAFRLQGDGRAVLVPADQALRLRMTLAEEGLPRGGSVGDEIFDQQSALGTTEFLANVNLRRALEGELARTIGSLRRRARGAGPSRAAPARAVPPPADRAERVGDPAHARRPTPRPSPGAGRPAPGRRGGARAVAGAHRAGRRSRHAAGAGRRGRTRKRVRRPRRTSCARPTKPASSGPSRSCWSVRSARAARMPKSTPSSISIR